MMREMRNPRFAVVAFRYVFVGGDPAAALQRAVNNRHNPAIGKSGFRGTGFAARQRRNQIGDIIRDVAVEGGLERGAHRSVTTTMQAVSSSRIRRTTVRRHSFAQASAT